MSKTLIFKPNVLLLWPFTLAVAGLGSLATMSVLNGLRPPVTDIIIFVILGLSVLSFLIASRRLKLERYLISDHSIQIQTYRYDSTVSLVNIDGVTGRPYRLLRYKKMGTIVITANGQTYVLRGLEDASSIAALIWQAAQTAKFRHEERNRPTYYQPPSHAAGTLELMNDLVGMWQQGMITDEEYNNEVQKLTADL